MSPRPLSPRAVVAALLVAACGGAPAHRTPASPAVPQDRVRALDHVPADAPAVLLATSLRAGARVLGLDAVLSGWLGSAPDAVGLAGDAPAGLAVLEPESDTAAVFATVDDRAALAEAIDGAAGRAGIGIERRRAGDALLLLPERGPAVVLHEHTALWIRSSARSRRDWHAVRNATLAPDAALGRSDPFRRTAGMLEPGADLVGWIDLPALLPNTALAEVLARSGPAAVAIRRAEHGAEARFFFDPARADDSQLSTEPLTPALLAALSEPPALAFGLRTTPARAAALLSTWLETGGVDARVSPELLTGAMEIAFAAGGLDARIGVTDPDRAAASARALGLPFEITAADGRLLVTSTPGLSGRVARPGEDASTTLDRLPGPRAGYAVIAGPIAAGWLPGSSRPAPELEFVDDTGAADGDYPASDDYRRAASRVRALQQQYLKTRAQLDQLRADQVDSLAGALGRIACTLGRAPGRHGGHCALISDAGPEALARATGSWLEARGTGAELGAALERIAGRHAEARRELIRVRLRDVTREQRRRESTSPPEPESVD